MDALRVACVQMRLGRSVAEGEQAALRWLGRAKDAGARLALLPEYWFLPEGERLDALDARFDGLDGWLQRASKELGMTVAANAPVRDGGLWNRLLVYDDGRLVGQQDKVHPMPTEERWGVQAAQRIAALPWDVKLGGLVCADVLHPEQARLLALQGAELLLNPVMSFRRRNDDTREARRAMFLARAYDNACFVLKAGSIAEDGPAKLAGRSLIAAPWGMLAEAPRDDAEELLLADLDLPRLREERKRSLSLDRRNPKAYAALADAGPPAAEL
ncbi:MAG: carbon-nitrogen hydrolase family protein [Halobacteriales archaeon]|nr:carbon-nitrogen hydrolase family protein [Halobacteriales archaeon]